MKQRHNWNLKIPRCKRVPEFTRSTKADAEKLRKRLIQDIDLNPRTRVVRD